MTSPLREAISAAPNYKANKDNDSDWPAPIPLTPDIEPPAEYPINALPPDLQRAALEVARFSKVPAASPAVVGLSCAAVAIGKRIRIEERPGLYHRPALFLAIIAATGERKSPSYKLITTPLDDWVRDHEDDWQEALSTTKANNAIAEKVIAGLEKSAKETISESERADVVKRIVDERARVKDLPPAPRFYTSDATEQVLFRLMHERGGEFAVMSGEGRTVFDLILGKFSGEGQTGDSIYLAGISGDTITRDRIGNAQTGQEERIIQDPMLNVCVMVQPDKFMEVARHPRLRDSGAIARIWSVWLSSMVGERIEEENEAGLDLGELAPYQSTIRQILEHEQDFDADGRPQSHLVRLGPDAVSARREWHNTIERMMVEGGELEDVRDIACKAVSATVKTAGILHIFMHPDYLAASQSEIDLETWARAQFLGEYHLREAIRVQRIAVQDQTLHEAHRIVEWLPKHMEAHGLTHIKAADLMQYGPRPRPNAKKAAEILTILEEYGYARMINQRGHHKPVYLIHPDLASLATLAGLARGGGGNGKTK